MLRELRLKKGIILSHNYIIRRINTRLRKLTNILNISLMSGRQPETSPCFLWLFYFVVLCCFVFFLSLVTISDSSPKAEIAELTLIHSSFINAFTSSGDFTRYPRDRKIRGP